MVQVKEQLSKDSKDDFAFSELSETAVKVTRSKFNSLINEKLGATITATEELIGKYHEMYGRNAKIDAIVLSGGSSLIPLVKKRLGKFGIDIDESMNPHRAISDGTVIFAEKPEKLIYVVPFANGLYIIYEGGKRQIKETTVSEIEREVTVSFEFDTVKQSKFEIALYERDDRYSQKLHELTKEAFLDYNKERGLTPLLKIIIKAENVSATPGKYTLTIKQNFGIEEYMPDIRDQNGKLVNFEIQRFEYVVNEQGFLEIILILQRALYECRRGGIHFCPLPRIYEVFGRIWNPPLRKYRPIKGCERCSVKP